VANRRPDGLAVFVLPRVPDVLKGRKNMNSGMNQMRPLHESEPSKPGNPRLEKAFPLPKDPPSRQDTKRELLGLFKQGPLETLDEFAERVTKQSNLALHRLRQERAKKHQQPKPSLPRRLFLAARRLLSRRAD
jgi:hypothetical protein